MNTSLSGVTNLVLLLYRWHSPYERTDGLVNQDTYLVWHENSHGTIKPRHVHGDGNRIFELVREQRYPFIQDGLPTKITTIVMLGGSSMLPYHSKKTLQNKSWTIFLKYPWIGGIFQHYAIVFYTTSRILHFYTKHVQISWRKGERNSLSLSFLPKFFCFGVPPIGGQFLLPRNKPVHVVRHFFLHLHGLDVDDEVASVSRRPQVVSLLGVWHEPENDLWKCAERFLDSAPPLFTYDLHDIFTTHKTSAQRHQDLLD